MAAPLGADASPASWTNLSWVAGWGAGRLGFRGVCLLGPMLFGKSENLGLGLQWGQAEAKLGWVFGKWLWGQISSGGSCQCCVCSWVGAGEGGAQRTAWKTDSSAV